MFVFKNIPSRIGIYFVVATLFFIQAFAMQNALNMDKGKHRQDDKEKIQLPLLTECFEQRLETLKIDSGSGYPLVFNHYQKPSITYYLLNGRPVARLLQIKDNMHFESRGEKSYDFLLQSPLQVWDSCIG